ncbi:MAG: 6-O-methylguanine DNA methyltransferase, partial [Proteobacteria bacterium]|nr:6-O-methylguanine DNA methyltransferase [Pseudomonadota bacterium]
MPSKKHLTREPDSKDYEIVEKALEFVQENKEKQPSVSHIAQAVNLNESAFEDLFSRWAGIRPLQFLQFLTRDYAKQILKQSKNILDTNFDSDSSTPGAMHDLFLHCKVMTPGENKKGAQLKIIYGFMDSPFGACMIAKAPQGICNLKFLRHHSKSQLTDWLAQQWPLADLEIHNKEIQMLSDSIFPQDINTARTPLHLYIKGTHFQIKVWEALTRIP